MKIDTELLSNIYMGSHENNLLLEDMNIDDGDLQVIINFLLLNRNITSINLSDNQITDNGIEHLVDFFSNNNHIKSINLSNNCIGEKGIVKLSDIKNNGLTEIDLSSNYNIGDSIGIISKLVQLRKLYASECNITDQGARELFNSSQIESLELCTNKIEGHSFSALKHNTYLSSLNLAQNSIRTDYLHNIVRTKLIYLNLDSTGIQDEGVSIISRHNYLESLMLGQCMISDHGATILSNTKLKYLNLFNNYITDISASKLIMNNTLLYLRLMGNPTTEYTNTLAKQNLFEVKMGAYIRSVQFTSKLLKSTNICNHGCKDMPLKYSCQNSRKFFINQQIACNTNTTFANFKKFKPRFIR
jgi:hypothetical protein